MSLLTFYRPNFCAECGSKIVRLRWRLWTSRKFCDACAPQFLKERLVQPVIAGLLVLLVGAMIGNAWVPNPPPLIIQRGTASTAGSLNGSSAPQPPVVEEQVYTCGARTKKGTPCSRRVHGPVRCWQHKGAKPMVAQEKLLIKE